MTWSPLVVILVLLGCSTGFFMKGDNLMQYLMRLKDVSVKKQLRNVDGELDTDVYKQTCENGDIALVVDSSSSITVRDFASGLQFLSDFTQLFNVGPKAVRFAAVSFGRGVYTEDAFGFEAYTNNDDVSDAILELEHHGGDWTATGEGIRYMREKLMASSRSDVEKIAVVITDGNSQEPEITEEQARLAHDSDITVFAIGVGKQVSYNELHSIASKPEYILEVDDYSSLETIKSILDNLICKAINIRKCGKGDISLVIDASSSIWPEDYEDGLEFLSDFANTFHIGPDAVRVSAVSYADVIYEDSAFGFDEYTTTDSLADAIEGITQGAGDRTETGMAIKYMRENQMSQARTNVNHTAIVITDGKSQETDKTAREATKAHASGIVMFAIGVGPGVSEPELISIASKKEYVLMVDDYASLQKIRERLNYAVCDELAEELCGVTNPSDIYFVYDGEYLGGSVSAEITSFVEKSVTQTEMSQGMQVGVISGLCEGSRGFPLNQYSNLLDMRHHSEKYFQSDLTSLVRYLHTEAYSQENGGRTRANHVAVLFVDGKVSIDELRGEVEIAKSQDILVFVVGIGNISYDDLASLASQPSETYVLEAGSIMEYAVMFTSRLCGK